LRLTRAALDLRRGRCARAKARNTGPARRAPPSRAAWSKRPTRAATVISPSLSGQRIEVVQADITEQDLDAIVNAANSALAHGGGVAGAIARAAGPELQRASDQLVAARGRLATGEAVATDGFGLRARRVIHAVGPVYGRHAGKEAELLASAHRSAVAVAAELGLSSIAFPAISCGIYGYPFEEAAPIAVSSTSEALDRAPGIGLVRFCLFGDRELAAFERALDDAAS
jgi:O-acetyl-ADP-ribose deacetylase (regulator of RNase III)